MAEAAEQETLEQKVAAAALAQAGAAEKENNQDKGDKPADKADPARGEDGRFKSMRQRIEKSEQAVKSRDQQIAKLEGRLDQLLDLVEKRSTGRSEPDADPFSHLKADDPDRDLITGKVKPVLDRTLGPLSKQIEEIKATLAAMQGEGKKSAAERERTSEYNEALANFIEERGLPPEAASIIAKLNRKGIGGDTYEDAFQNALIFHIGQTGGKAAGKAEAAAKASVGGVMPGMASSPEPSGDFKALRARFQQARADGDGNGEAIAFTDLLKRAQEEQGR